MTQPILTPFTLGDLQLANRIAMAPMTRARSGEDRIPNELMAKYYAQRAGAGLIMTEAAYNHGEEWLAQLIEYLDENRRIFDERVNAISGLKSMALESTYLGWVDFSGTGMAPEEFIARVEKQARIGANHGETFGKGGENFLRFNFALPRSLLLKALDRLEEAFSDLQ